MIRCKFCAFRTNDILAMAHHLEQYHGDLIPEDMTASQFYYKLKTGKDHGSCVMCHKNTEWNEKTHKYHRFCNDPKCKEKYREIFKKRMIGTHGKITLLNEPAQQKIMLAHRKISGEYLWSDGKSRFTYTGSYEHEFLKFLDLILDWDPMDLMTPSPHTYYYEYEGKKRFYIPDMFIPSLRLEIEIKDGGDNPNMHHKIQEVDKVKERLKDEVMLTNKCNFNYIKIVNKEHKKFLQYLEKNKEQFALGIEKPIVML